MKRCVVVCLLLGACKTTPAAGPSAPGVVISTYGEEYIEEGMPPAPADDQPGVADGWAISFDKFLVVFSDVRLDGTKQSGRTALSTPVIVDVHQKGPTPLVDMGTIEPGLWDRVSIAVLPAKGAIAKNAGADDVAMMNQHGWSVFVAGRVTKDNKSVKFAWGFDTSTRYEDCQDSTSHAGVFVEDGKMPAIQFTIHGDHLFLDDFDSPYARPRAAAIASSDADGDGTVTLDEMKKISLSSLPQVPYASANEQLKTLADLVTALSRTLVHFQGEGECKTE